MQRDSFFSFGILFRDRQKAQVFIICLGFASAVWLLMALSKSYSAEVNFPLSLYDFPDGKTLVSEVPSEVSVNVSGDGYGLLKYGFGFGVDTVFISLSQMSLNQTAGYAVGFLNQQDILNRAQIMLGSELVATSVGSDSLSLRFDALVEKVLPTRANVQYDLDDDHLITSDPEVTPASIKVRGAKSHLDTLEAIFTEKIVVESDDDLRLNGVPLVFTGPVAPVDHFFKQVDVKLNVDELIEGEVDVKLNLSDSSQNVDFVLNPTSVTVSFRHLSRRERPVVDSDFTVVVSAAACNSTECELPARMVSWPRDLMDIEVSPELIEVAKTIEQ